MDDWSVPFILMCSKSPLLLHLSNISSTRLSENQTRGLNFFPPFLPYFSSAFERTHPSCYTSVVKKKKKRKPSIMRFRVKDSFKRPLNNTGFARAWIALLLWFSLRTALIYGYDCSCRGLISARQLRLSVAEFGKLSELTFVKGHWHICQARLENTYKYVSMYKHIDWIDR